MYDIGFRRAVILFYDACQSIRKTAAVMKCSTTSVWRWTKRVHAASRTRKSIITESLIEVVRHALDRRPQTSCSRLVQVVHDALGVQVSRQLIHNVVSRRLKYSYKRSRKRGVPRRGEGSHRATALAFAKDYVDAMGRNELIVAIDESGFDTGSSPRYGFAPRGKRHVVLYRRASDRKHHSLIMAIDSSGGHEYEIETSRVDGPRFARFVRSLPYPPGTKVVMDNASIHWTKQVRDECERRGYVPLKMPAYSPDLNPIELVFGIAKSAWYRADTRGDSVSEVHRTIRNTVEEASRGETVRRCFQHVTREMPRFVPGFEAQARA